MGPGYRADRTVGGTSRYAYQVFNYCGNVPTTCSAGLVTLASSNMSDRAAWETPRWNAGSRFGENHIRPNTGAVYGFCFLSRFGPYEESVVGISGSCLLSETVIQLGAQGYDRVRTLPARPDGLARPT